MHREGFNPTWLIIGRQSRGLTQKSLADSLSVTQGWLSKVEGGLRIISSDKLKEIADLLDYPVDFFTQANPPHLRGSDIFHRKIFIPDKALDQIYARLLIFSTRLNQLLQGVEVDGAELKPVDLEEFNGSIEDVARIVRSNWGMPLGPIENVTEIIESTNAIVVPFDFGTRRIDATSVCLGKLRPLFFVNPSVPGDRLRFTLCHELAHVLMHQGVIRENAEDEANRFAGEFLMPARQIKPYLCDLSLPKLATLKIQWKVSMAALLKRAQTLATITPSQAKRLWVQMSPFRQREPEELDIPIEAPRLYGEIIDIYKEELDYSDLELSKFLRLNQRDTYSLFLRPPQYEVARDAVDEAEQIIRESHQRR